MYSELRIAGEYARAMSEQTDQAQKSEGLMRMAACDCSMLIVAVWWGRGKKHGGLK